MKICIDLTSLDDNFSGIERFALSITKELIKNSEHNWVLLFKNTVHEEFVQTGENVSKIVIHGRNKLFFNQFRLPFKLARIKADKYFFPAFPAPFFCINCNAVSLIPDLGCWDCPSNNKRYMTLYFRIMYRKAALGKKTVVTISQFSKKRIEHILKKDPTGIKVIYCGISECFETFKYSEKDNQKTISTYNLPKTYILCLSTIEPRKNMRLLIEAYDELLSEKEIDVDLVLAGRKGWLIDDLLNGINSKTLNRIHFTGFVEDNLLPYIYYNAKVFVFPSIYEGFGIPPIEAMSIGVPVISSDAASMPEILGNSAIFFKSNDKEQLKTCILNVLSLNEYELLRLKEKGIACAKKYSWSTEALKLLSYLEQENKQ